jgi:hypothetical protein
MRYSICEFQLRFDGYFLLEDILVIMGDDGGVLHCAPFVLVGEDLVVFVEGVRIAKEGLEEF